MKIGIIYDPYQKGYARFGSDCFEVIRRHGFSAIDFNMADTETPLYALNDAEFEKHLLAVRAQVEQAGLFVSQVHGPWRSPRDSTEAQRRERMEKMKKSIWAARLLGCKYWVIHPIMPYGTRDLETDNGPETWALNLTFMAELLACAKTQDITICLENMPFRNFSMATPTKVLEFVQAMNDDHFGICLDTGHVAVFPGLSPGDALRQLGSHIKVLHIHDNMGDMDTHMWPTTGTVDWKDFARALRQTGFDGVFSLETSPAPDATDTQFEADAARLFTIAREIVDNI